MAKYLLQANYTQEGVKGVLKDGGTARRSAASQAAESLGGRVESFYFAFGATDVFVIADLPDHASAAALSLAVAASGAVTARTTVLMTPDEMDQACRKTPSYRGPGQK